jgi:hypothetical protein
MGQDLADGRGDVRRVEGCGSHLVQQGLEQMVVLPVEDGDPELAGTAQGLGGPDAAESSAHDYDARIFFLNRFSAFHVFIFHNHPKVNSRRA